VTAHHEDPTKPPDHAPVHVDVVLEIRREKIFQVSGTGNQGIVKDQYKFDWWVAGEGYLRANSVLPKERNGVCEPQHQWLVGSPIAGNFVFPSADIDINAGLNIGTGDLVLLRAEGVDNDVLALKCVPVGGPCKVPAESSLTMNDLLYYEWTADKGEFVNGNAPDRETVWRAPTEACKVRISLMIRNSGGHTGGTETQFNDEPVFIETTFEVRKSFINPGASTDNASTGSAPPTVGSNTQPGAPDDP
jgi:hypothetical protein